MAIPSIAMKLPPSVADYWAKERERNPSGRVPAEYTRPSETSVMVEVSQALYDEVMEKGWAWAHYTSHLESHAKLWSKRQPS